MLTARKIRRKVANRHDRKQIRHGTKLGYAHLRHELQKAREEAKRAGTR